MVPGIGAKWTARNQLGYGDIRLAKLNLYEAHGIERRLVAFQRLFNRTKKSVAG